MPARSSEVAARREALLVALGLAALVAWTLRGLRAGELLGREGTDALRALWGQQILARALVPPDLPFWTRQVNPPAGALGFILPWLSGLLAAPLSWVLDPVSAFDAFIAALLWAAGMGTATLAREESGSWAAGFVAGAALLASPMLLWAVSDGTTEHVAVWTLPLCLAVAARALRRGSPRLAVAAGLLWGAVALDSPYHAIYAVTLGAVTLPFAAATRGEAQRTALGWTLAVLGGTLLGVALALGLAYALLPVGTGGGLPAEQLQAINTANLGTWARAGLGALPAEGPAPTLIPTGLLLGALGLSALAPRRAAPWAAAGALALCLSFGRDERLIADLSARIGAAGGLLGRGVLGMNALLYGLPGLGGMRFPSRWLVPAELCLGVGASIGLARLLSRLDGVPLARWGLGLALAAYAFASSLRAGPLARALPTQRLPTFAFTTWIHEQPEEGAVALLPILRPAPPAQGRNDRPVFASLDPSLSGLDGVTLQVLHGRPQLGAPGLQTLRPLVQDSTVTRVQRDWDDLTHPRLTGDPIPPGANDPRADRARGQGITILVESGLRWVAVDLGAYDAEGLAELRRQLAPFTASEHRFDEGDGVLVLTLAPREEGP